VRRGRVDPAAILKWQDEEKSKQWTLHPFIDEVRIDLPLNLSQQVVSGDFFLRVNFPSPFPSPQRGEGGGEGAKC
jgi:hypothetical protein